MVEPYKPLYTVSEVAKILKINPNTVYDLIDSGQLLCLNLGMKKIRGVDLERFINNYPAENAVHSKNARTANPGA